MKKILLVLAAHSLYFFSCATETPPAPAAAVSAPEVSAAEVPELDAAIETAARYFAENIPAGLTVAVADIETDRPALSDYIAQEFHRHLEASRRFTLINNQNRDTVRRELFFQNTAEVSAESRHKIGETLGADVMLYGELRAQGDAFRLVTRAVEIESGRSLAEQPVTVSLPPEWSSPPSVDDRIDRAVFELGRKLYMQTPVIVGGITVGGTTASTSLSDFLRPRFIGAMQKRGGLFRVLDEKSGNVSAEAELAAAEAAAAGGGNAAVPARLVGEFPPRGSGEEVPVSLSLVALAGGEVYGSALLTLSAQEMQAAGVSALPPNTTLEKFEAKRKALAEYGSMEQAFRLTVTPDEVSYHEGDALYFSIYAEEDCYFQVINYDAQDNVSLMFPANARDWERNFIRAGETRRFPDTPRYTLREPYGLEYVIVMAYREQIKVKAERPSHVTPQAILQQLNLKGYVDNENPDNYGKTVNVPPAASAFFSYTILENR